MAPPGGRSGVAGPAIWATPGAALPPGLGDLDAVPGQQAAGQVLDLDLGLVVIDDRPRLQQASLVGLQIAAPILALAIAVNVAAGLLSRFMPQAPVYFLITPLLIGAGFLVLFMAERPMFGLFLDALAKRIATL